MEFSDEEQFKQLYKSTYRLIKDRWLYREQNKEKAFFYLQAVDDIDGAWVHSNGSRKLMFTTHNYLGLLGDERLNQAAADAVMRYGTGTQGSRLLGGTLSLHDMLEKKIAEFAQREDAIVYTSGYITNLTTINALVGRDGWVISDKLNHASIIDGCIISKAQHKRFKHNDMDDLARILKKAPADVMKLVVADAVFSMDGDIFNLPGAADLCKKYNSVLMIDEAHSLGTIGKSGHGIEEHFGMANAIDIKMGTLSKAIPAAGGFVAGDKRVINYLRQRARGFVFSSAMPPAVAAAAYKAIEIIEMEGSARQSILNKNVQYFLARLKAEGFNTGITETPIIPILVEEDAKAIAMARFCQDNGVFVMPVISPAVAPGAARLRINVTAQHTLEDIDYALQIIIKAGVKAGTIQQARQTVKNAG